MQKTDFYIDGAWVQAARCHPYDIISPSDGTPSATISVGSADNVGRTVAVARSAFEAWSEMIGGKITQTTQPADIR
ncbi:aldehyde dehydrogenase (NAD+) [Rhizobium miluonense]|uniref:Aldehyde dehydrogenase (NAD+) n=2 Tax=Rhizobium miluonense TaxID=411945 RepID=A0A1C3W3J6_9HYPH|nr:aldehyde dehydrogenase (NAD+) [Rhizobium miluonense]